MRAYAVSSVSVDRRRVVQGLLALLFSAGLSPRAHAQKSAAPLSIVRISRGSFAPEKYDSIRTRLDAAQSSLVPAIRKLTGCIHYFAAIDRESSSMVNVSVWRTLADAQQMQTFGPMLALAAEFTQEGVRFERPIINYESLWVIDGVG